MLTRFQPYTLFVLRLITGFIFFLHGLQKLFGAFGGALPPNLPPNVSLMLQTAGWLETFGGGLIILGLYTSPVAFILSGEMASAYFVGHVARSGKVLPVQNGGSEAALDCFIFLYLFTAGPGAWSIDAQGFAIETVVAFWASPPRATDAL
jgi:putative oxidoreductase